MEDKEKIQWHPAFRQAIKAELAEYRDVLEFIEEYPLTTEPLKIDTVIIKKPPEVYIKKNIGRIFKGHNIIEFKSPEDTLDVDSYNKTFAYAHLYASLTSTDINDITVTLVSSSHPRNLLNHLSDDPKLGVGKPDDGIYYVNGERMLVQIIETKSLAEEDNLWLRSLRNGLKESTIKRLIVESKQYDNEMRAYMYAVLEANEEILRGDVEMSFVETLMENPTFVKVAEEKGFGNVAREKLKIARNLLKRNRPIDEIVEDTGLTREEVEGLRNAD